MASKIGESFSVMGGVDFRIDKRGSNLQHTNGMCQWAPDGSAIASAKGNRVKVWSLVDPDTNEQALTCVASYSMKDAVSNLEWSSDSKYLLCAMYKIQTVRVVPADQTDKWSCTVCEGPVAGMVHARWAPDARHVLTTADFNLHMTVWSLTSKTVYYIKDPKDPVNGIAFSNDGKFVAVAQRRKCKDFIGIYYCETWELVKEFPVDSTDLAGICWSPDDSVLAIRDNIMQYQLLVYAPDGVKQVSYQAYKMGLGIKTLTWSDNAQFLALGSFDEKVRVMNHLTWTPIATYKAAESVDGNSTNLFVEVIDKKGKQKSVGAIAESKAKEAADGGAGAGAGAGAGVDGDDHHTVDPSSHYELKDGEFTIPRHDPTPHPTKSPPRLGIGRLAWSKDARFLAMRNDNTPTTVYVYETVTMALKAVLVHTSAVHSIAWSPKCTRLAISTGNSKIYFWEEAGATCLSIMDGFTALRLRWNPDGEKLIVMSRNSWTCGYLET